MREQGYSNVATSGYQVYEVWTGAQNAAFGTPAEALAASRTGFIPSLMATTAAIQLANHFGPYAACAASFCSATVTPASADGSGNLTIGAYRTEMLFWNYAIPIGKTQVWPFP